MPLKINDSPEPPRDARGGPQPILNYPADQSTSRRKVILTVFLLVVIGAAIFLLYVFIYMNSGKTSQGPSSSKSPEVAAAPAQKAPEEPKNPAPPATLQPVAGQYTIYIASYVDKQDADQEVGRWRDAGFEAFDVHAFGHYRVALGQYADRAEARRTAEKWQEAFENGYWIGKFE